MCRHSRQLWVFLLALIWALMLMPFSAFAQESAITVSIELDRTAMTGPDTVNVTVRVTNAGSASETVQLFDPANKVVPSFGDGGSMVIAAGETRDWTGTWDVTREQLSAGSIAYTIRYKSVDASGAIVDDSRLAVASVAYESERVELDVVRTVPQLARTNATFHVVYTLRNLGNVALKDITVKENKGISTTAKTLDTLAPGASVDVDFSVKMGSNELTSNATITYTPENATKSESTSVGKVNIGVAKPALSFSVKSDKESVQIGEDVTLTITFSNEGNVVYSNVSVSDPELGTLFENQTIQAGTAAKPTVLTLTHVVRMNKKYKFQFVMNGDDNTGNHPNMSANGGDPLIVNAVDPTQVMLITLVATPERYTIETMPEDMRFELVITNASTVDAEDVAIMHGAVHVYTIPELIAGQSVTLRRDFSVSQGGKYQFTAACKNQMGEDVSFLSDPVIISYAPPAPDATAAPTVNIPKPTDLPKAVESESSRTVRVVFNTFGVVFGSIAAVLLALVLLGVFSRIHRRRQSAKAVDHLDLGERRDYTSKGDHDEPEPQEVPEDDPTDESPYVMPHEKYLSDDASEEDPSPQGSYAFPEYSEPDSYDHPDEDEPLPADDDMMYRHIFQPESEAAPDGADEDAPFITGDTGGYRLHREDQAAPQPSVQPRARVRRRGNTHTDEGFDD